MTSGQPERRSYFEDVQTGVPLETPAMTLTETHVALFASLTTTRPGEPGAIPDLLPLCLSSGLGWRVPQPPLVVLAFMGFEWEVLQPVRVGDTIHSIARIAVKRSMREGGVIVEGREVINQRAEIVHRGRFTYLVAKRPPA